MTNSVHHQAEVLQDRYGLKVAARLSAGAVELPHDIAERLRVARSQALTRRKPNPASATHVVGATGGSALLGFGNEGLNWWSRVASALPLVALAIGLVAIDAIQEDHIAREQAEVDAALLVDDLPPAAYADPGFAQFLKIGNDEAR